MANRKVAGAVRLALIAASAAGITAYSAGTFAQDAELEQVVVTGSRIARAELDSEAPLAIVTSADIARTGLNNVGDILQNLTVSDGTGLRPVTTQTNGSDGSNNISLRNLGAARTLILVDGRRWVTDGSGIVDLNTIPASMIERVEVLKDGASAIYGSDAIAGVINIITKRKFEGLQLDAYGGITDQGDGLQEAYGVTMGASGERSNGILGVNYSSQEAIMAGDRRITKVSSYGCSDPPAAGTPGAFCGSGTGQYGRFFVSGYPSSSYFLTPSRAETGGSSYSLADFTAWNNNGRYNFAPVNYLQQPIERTNLFAAGNALLSDNIEAYAKVIYTKMQSAQQLAQVPVTMAMSGANGPQWKIPINAGQYFNPFGQTINTASWRAVPVGPRNPTYDYDTYGINLGVKGDFGLFNQKYRWDVGLQYNDGQYDKVGHNYINLFNLRNALGPSFRDASGLHCGTPGNTIRNCVPLNIFGGPDLGVARGVVTAAEAQAMVNYISYTQVATSGLTSTNWYADISGDLFDLPAGAVGIAIGTEFRKNEYFNQPDTLVASGGSSDNYQEQTNGQESVSEYYVELNIPLLKDLPGAQELTLNAANRWSDYSASGKVGAERVSSDPGNPSTSKLGLTWRPLKQLLVRGAWGETFRAPSVYDLYAGGGESFPQATDPCRTVGWATLTSAQQARCMADGVPSGGVVQTNTQIRALVGGNPYLLPEQGNNWTAGFVWEPEFVDNLSLIADYWNIKLTDALSSLSASSVLSRCYKSLMEEYCPFVERVPTGEIAQVRTANFNLAERQTDGIDFGARYALDTDSIGKFGFNFDATYTMHDKSKLTGGSWSDDVGFYDGNVHWEWRAQLVTTWSLDNLSASWTMRYTSALKEDCFYAINYGATNYWNGKPQLCTNPNQKMDADMANYFGYDVGQPGVNNLRAMLYHDLQFAYALPWNGTITVGGRNVTGEEPPTSQNGFAQSFDGAYDLPGGAFWYASYKQKF